MISHMEKPNPRPGLDPERDRAPKLSWHDDERLQNYIGVGHDLIQRSPLGHQLECFRDNVRIQGMPDTHPQGDWGYGNGTAYNRARETALRLWDTERLWPGAVAALWVYCHPTSVALDGLPGSRGRLFTLTPQTELGRRAKRSAGSDGWCSLQAPRLIGPRECKCEPGTDCVCWSRPALVRRLYAESVESKGDQRRVWMQIYEQARVLICSSVDAWNATQGAEDERRLQRAEIRRAAAHAQSVTPANSDG